MNLLDRFLSTAFAYRWRRYLPTSWRIFAAQAQFNAELALADDSTVHFAQLRQIVIDEPKLNTMRHRSLVKRLDLLHRAKDNQAHRPDQEWWIALILRADNIEDALLRTETAETLIAMAYNDLLPGHETQHLARVIPLNPLRTTQRMLKLEPGSLNWLVFAMHRCNHEQAGIILLMRAQQEVVLDALKALVLKANDGTGGDVGDTHKEVLPMLARTIERVEELRAEYQRLAGFEPEWRSVYEAAMSRRLYMFATRFAKSKIAFAEENRAWSACQRAYGP